MSQLAAAQAAFFKGLQPEASLHTQQQAALWLDATDAFSAIGRLGVYRDMYVLRLIEALRIDYEQCARALGDAAFAEMARSYIIAYPPKTPSLNGVGVHFAQHLQMHTAVRADLADLARLEWARVMAAHKPVAAALSFADWLALGPQRGPHVHFVMNPSLVCVQTAHTVCALWHALEHKTPMAAPIEQISHTAVWRDAAMVAHRALQPIEAQALAMLYAGSSFTDLCTLFVQAAQPAQSAAQLMAQLFASRFIVGTKEP